MKKEIIYSTIRTLNDFKNDKHTIIGIVGELERYQLLEICKIFDIKVQEKGTFTSWFKNTDKMKDDLVEFVCNNESFAIMYNTKQKQWI